MGHIITIDLVWSLTKVIETTVDILWYAEVIHVIDHDLKIWSHSRKKEVKVQYHLPHWPYGSNIDYRRNILATP